MVTSQYEKQEYNILPIPQPKENKSYAQHIVANQRVGTFQYETG